MNEETTKLIEQLATKLGTTAEHLWGILVRQAYVNAITSIVVNVILLTVTSLFFVYYRRRIKTFDDDEDRFWLWLVFCAWGLFATVWFNLNLNDIINGLVNPEYYAFKQIVK